MDVFRRNPEIQNVEPDDERREREVNERLNEYEREVRRILDADPDLRSAETQEELAGVYAEVETLLVPRREALGRAIADPEALPSVRQVLKAFPFEDFSRENVRLMKAWHAFSNDEAHLFFELLTEEYVEGYAELLEGEIERIGRNGDGPVRVLEVGAGNGKLSRHVQRILREKGMDVEMMAVDDSSWAGRGVALGENVRDMDYRDALSEFRPDIVMESWMPPGKDFSPDFRNTESVKAYVLTGPMRDSGTPETWGAFEEDFEGAREAVNGDTDSKEYKARATTGVSMGFKSGEIEAVDVGGFTMTAAPEKLRDVQISRMKDVLGGGEESTTMVFRRPAPSA